jgi:hypothetical protein
MVGSDKLEALGEWKLQNSKELTRLQEDHKQLVDRAKMLEDENKKFLSQLNQVLMEKDGLSKIELQQRDKMLEEERAQLGEARESHTKEQLELKNKHLEDQLQQAREQVHQYSVKLQRAKEVSDDMVFFSLFLLSPLPMLGRPEIFIIHCNLHCVIVHRSSGWSHQGECFS